jgi:phage gpG-like protein
VTLRVSVTVKDDEVLGLVAKNLAKAEFGPAFGVIAEAMHSETLETFDQQRDPWGVPWKPLAPSTIARRRLEPPDFSTFRKSSGRAQKRSESRSKERGTETRATKRGKSRRKAKGTTSTRALVLSDNLRSAIVPKSGKTFAEVRVTSKAAAALNPMGQKTIAPTIYAATQQYGRGHVPARPFMLLGPDKRPRLTPEVEASIVDALTEAVLKGVPVDKRGRP